MSKKSFYEMTHDEVMQTLEKIFSHKWTDEERQDFDEQRAFEIQRWKRYETPEESEHYEVLFDEFLIRKAV